MLYMPLLQVILAYILYQKVRGHGLSGTKYMPESLGAKAYIALTGEFLRRIEGA